jgi:hypothetical protein
MLDALRESKAVVKTMTFFAQFFAACTWVYLKIMAPVARPFIRLGRTLFRWYRAAWARFVYRTDGSFSWARSGVMLTATIIAFYIIPHVMMFTFHATLYLTTAKTEDVFLTQSQEIYPDDDIHSVKGCDSLPCNEMSSIYFRVQPSWFNQAWALVNNGSLFYPDYVAAAVPPGISECTILSYGFRLKFLMRRYDIYPDMLTANCRPVRNQ